MKYSNNPLLIITYTYFQDMCVMEGELEILLGELHIKMKGKTHVQPSSF